MPVLIGCEFSATVRDALRRRGLDAWSCDFLPTEGDPRWHLQTCVREAIRTRPWELIILHLECTKVAVSGNRHYGKGKPRHGERLEAIEWSVETVRQALMSARSVAVENPASVLFPALRERLNATVQYVQPWQHGHPEMKKTGFATWDLPALIETNNVYEQMMTLPRSERERIHFMSPGPDRWKERSRTYPGLASAIADQWGGHILSTSNRVGPDQRELFEGLAA